MVLCLTVDQVPTEDPIEPEVGDASKVLQALGSDFFFLKDGIQVLKGSLILP
jgi:hypothetical protein